jgi:hypothetical protein
MQVEMGRLIGRIHRLAVPVVAVSAAAIAAAPAHAAGFTCEASALKLSVLGSKTVEPVTANQGAGSCSDVTRTLTGKAAGLPLPFLDANSLVAATSVSGPPGAVEKQRVLASAGLADLTVGALPDLPISLPAVTIPDALKSVHVDLSPLNQVLSQTSGDVSSLLGQVTTTTGGAGDAGGVLGGGTGPVCVLGVCLRQASSNLLPSSIDIDVAGAVQSLLPDGKLPSLELLGVKGATAYAGGQCANGKPFVDGAAQTAGVRVLGQDLPLGAVLDKTMTLINQATIDPSQADLGLVQLPSSVTSLGLNLTNSPLLHAAVQKALDGLGDVKVLDPTLARVLVTPGAKTRSGETVTQTGPTVDVTVAGVQLLHAVLGEAKAGAANVHCTRSTQTAADVTQQCTKRRLVLVDVLEGRRRVSLRGIADPNLAGRTVGIRFSADGHVVAHAKVHRDGSFQTTAPLPPGRLRGTNSARYQARVGRERSLSLKLRRRMILRTIRSHSGTVTIAGRVVPPLGAPVRSVVLKRRVSCGHTEVVKRFKPAADGSFRVTVKAPKGVGAAVYRLSTSVRKTRSNPKLYPTFTLPRAVELNH